MISLSHESIIQSFPYIAKTSSYYCCPSASYGNLYCRNYRSKRVVNHEEGEVEAHTKETGNQFYIGADSGQCKHCISYQFPPWSLMDLTRAYACGFLGLAIFMHVSLINKQGSGSRNHRGDGPDVNLAWSNIRQR